MSSPLLSLQYHFQKPFPYKYFKATNILIGINVGAFLITIFFKAITGSHMLMGILGLSYAGVVKFHMWWQFLTYFFIHDTTLIFHILFNMLVLYLIGSTLERQMGSIEFLVYYLTTGLCAGIFHFLIGAAAYAIKGDYEGMAMTPLIGASGAIFAIILAYGVYFPNTTLLLYGIIPIKAKNALIIFTLIELINLLPIGHSNVSNITHIGGLVAGIIYLRLRKNINAFKVIFPPKPKFDQWS